MDGWTALVTTQKSLRARVLAQYYELDAKNRCAVAFGMAPVQGVTLHTDVLGQLVFSALDRTVAGSRSAEARRLETDQLLDSLDSTVRMANKAGNLMYDDKLSLGEKVDTLIDSFGGKREVFQALLGIAGIGVTGAAGLKGSRAGALSLIKQYCTQPPVNEHIYTELKNSDFKPTNNTDSELMKCFDGLLNAYNDMKVRQDEAFNYIASRPVTKDVLLGSLLTNASLTGDQKAFVERNKDLFGNENVENPLVRAILIWIETTVCGFQQLLKVGGCSNTMQFNLNELDQTIQGMITVVAAGNTPAAKAPAIQSVFPQKTKESSMDVCKQLLEIYVNDSIATRFLVQTMIQKCAPAPT